MKNTALLLFLFTIFAYFEPVYGQESEPLSEKQYEEYEKYYEGQEKKSKKQEQSRDEQLKDEQQEDDEPQQNNDQNKLSFEPVYGQESEPLSEKQYEEYEKHYEEQEKKSKKQEQSRDEQLKDEQQEDDEPQQNNDQNKLSSVSSPAKGGLKPNSFFLRLHGGVGQSHLVPEDDDGTDYTDLGMSLNVQGGWVLTSNLAVHGGFSYIVPSYKADMIPGETRDGVSNVKISYNQFIYTLGLSYYFASNAYISPELRLKGHANYVQSYKVSARSLGPPIIDTLEYNETIATYNAKLGFGLSIGKEWELSSRLALGLALIYYQDNFEGDKISTYRREESTSMGISLGYSSDTTLGGLEQEISHTIYGIVLSVHYN